MRNLGILTLICAAAPAAAFDVDRALATPGVRLVAVEFYATWCKPCIAAVPKWKALHERYRDQGLRLVVVATQDPGGGCANPGWNPDEIVCDDDGALAQRFGASKLPAAFLWSWQGPMLVRAGHVEDVEQAIERWLRETPRVEVSVKEVAANAKITKAELLDRVRSQIHDQDKLIVIATEEERRRLDAIKARSLEARFDDKLQCEVGKELSANSLLEASIINGRLSLSLLSVERGCLVAISIVDWRADKPNVGVAAAVTGLMQKIQRPAQSPSAVNVARVEAPEPVAATAVAPSPPPRPSPAPIAVLSQGDIDGDGVADPQDKCSGPQEVMNAYQDHDGCPDEIPTTIQAQLGVADVRFKTGQASLLAESHARLDQLVKVLRDFPDIRLRIEVHSDNVGAHDANVRLTTSRAETIRSYLSAKGIDATRLDAKGFGPTMPIDSNATAKGRARNRRVELHLATRG